MEIYLGIVGCISPLIALATIWLRDFSPIGEPASRVLMWALGAVLVLLFLIPIAIGLIAPYID